jgi:hypothetical protein
VYHLELRHFPHNLCRFNLTEEGLHAVVKPWAREQWVELGERKWSPDQARLTILEGPRIPVQQLAMGRGWRNAQRQSEDVTERVLAAERALAGAPAHPPRKESPSDLALQGDSLGLELLSLLEGAPAPLSRAWSLAQARFPEHPASECLALAEQAVRSLLQRRLIVLLAARAADPIDPAGPERAARLLEQDAGGVVPEEEIELLLRAVESWAAEGESAAVRMRRT